MEIEQAEWKEEAKKRYGDNSLDWKFRCPSCNNAFSVQDWKDAGAEQGEVAFSCVGRNKSHPKEMGDKTGDYCNYAGGGLFRINPVHIIMEEGTRENFDFADDPLVKEKVNGR